MAHILAASTKAATHLGEEVVAAASSEAEVGTLHEAGAADPAIYPGVYRTRELRTKEARVWMRHPRYQATSMTRRTYAAWVSEDMVLLTAPRLAREVLDWWW